MADSCFTISGADPAIRFVGALGLAAVEVPAKVQNVVNSTIP